MNRSWQRQFEHLKEIEPGDDLWDRVLAASPHDWGVSLRTRLVSGAFAAALCVLAGWLLWSAFAPNQKDQVGGSHAAANGDIAVTAVKNRVSEIEVFNPSGELVRALPLKALGEITSPGWSKDGNTLTVSGQDGLYAMNADGSNLRRLSSQPEMLSPTLSPNGKTIAAAIPSTQGLYIYLIDVASGKATPLLPDSPAAPPSPVGAFGFAPGVPYQTSPDWSPDDSKIAFADHGIHVVNADGTGLAKIAADGSLPKWSPDGTAFAYERGQGASSSIWTMNADGTDQRQITHLGGLADAPAWSPDGTMIVFNNDPVDAGTHGEGVQSSTPDLYVVNPDGTGLRKIAPGVNTDSRYCCEQPAWQPSNTAS